MFELQAVRDDGGDVHAALRAREALGVQAHGMVLGRLEVAVRGPRPLGLPRRVPDPIGGVDRLHRRRPRGEEIQRPIGDAQLVDRVGDHALRAHELGLTDAGRLHQGGRGCSQ